MHRIVFRFLAAVVLARQVNANAWRFPLLKALSLSTSLAATRHLTLRAVTFNAVARRMVLRNSSA